MLDVVVLGVTSWLLVWYREFRNELLQHLRLDWLRSNWNLGQVLALAAEFPIVIGFLRNFGTFFLSLLFYLTLTLTKRYANGNIP